MRKRESETGSIICPSLRCGEVWVNGSGNQCAERIKEVQKAGEAGVHRIKRPK
jgi:hypothetical protein